MNKAMELASNVSVEIMDKKPTSGDLSDLCDATEAAIKDGGGFGWVDPPVREKLEAYWKGVILIPDKYVFVGRLDGVIAASAQLHFHPANNEAQSFAGVIAGTFVAPWARGYGLGTGLIQKIEKLALEKRLKLLRLDLRETQINAIHLFERLEYKKWAENDFYACVEDKFVKGFYYQKLIAEKS